MIAIVNYGVDDVQMFANIYKRLNIAVGIASSPLAISPEYLAANQFQV